VETVGERLRKLGWRQGVILPATHLLETLPDSSPILGDDRLLANISDWDPLVIEGLRVLFKGGHASSKALEEQFEVQRSLPHGHVAAVLGTLRQSGLHNIVERRSGRQRALAMELIAGRILFPGSKLASCQGRDRLALTWAFLNKTFQQIQ